MTRTAAEVEMRFGETTLRAALAEAAAEQWEECCLKFDVEEWVDVATVKQALRIKFTSERSN